MRNMFFLSEKISAYYWLAKTQLYYRPAFARIGRRSRIFQPLKLRNVQNISIGEQVSIASFVWLATYPALANLVPEMVIGEGCQIGHFNHITCVNSVRLGRKVLTADRVHISDNSHSYENPTIPILEQPVVTKGPVEIGDGTWIGENVSVLSCRIGRNCVIGANAVVIKDVPDFCVVAGVPGRVIRQFDPVSGIWKRPQS